MTDPEVLVECADGVAVITMNRPQARNAVNRAMAQRLAAAFDEFDERRDLHVAILTGAGSGFCAGMDLKALLHGEPTVVSERGFAGLVERPPAKPLIAAVEGHALAGGFEIVLACDLVVAGRSATLGIPEVKRGLVAAGGGLLRLPGRIPYHLAMELALTGQPIDAVRAHELGLVNRLVDDGGALAAAQHLARMVVANGPLAVAATKRVIVESADWRSDEAFRRQGAIVDPVRRSADAREGAAAFVEKRAPVWKSE
jgi:enoyl-CoA hydratase